MPAYLIMFSPAAFEPKAPSTMHCDSVVPAEWQQNISNPFFCEPRSSLGIWATLLDKSVGVFSAHFSQLPSLVKATHPRDQHDWTATIVHQCLRVTSEHMSWVPSACSSCRSILVNPFGDTLDTLAPSLQWNNFDADETDSLKKDKPSMSRD